MSSFFMKWLLGRMLAPKNERLMEYAQSYRGKLYYEINGERFKVKYKYTIIDPGQSDRVLFVNHGALGSHKSLLKKDKYSNAFFSFQSLFNQWLDRGTCPKIVAITFGRIFFLTDQHPDEKKKDKYATIDNYWRVVTEMHRRHSLIDDEDYASMIGLSMGGLNSFNLVARSPQYIKKLVLLSPMTPDNPDPWDRSDKEFKSAILIRSNFEPDVWRKHNPHDDIKGPIYSGPPVHLQYATEDEWGLASGGKALGDMLVEDVPGSEVFAFDGGHGMFDPKKVLDFLDDDIPREDNKEIPQ